MKEEVQINEKEIAFKIKNDSLKALKELYEFYQKKIFYFSLRYLNSEEEAKEQVQNAFLLLWEHRKNIDEEQSISSYLFKIVSNQIYNTLHKKTIKSKYEEYASTHLDLHQEDTLQHVFYQDLKTIIFKLLEKLPPQRKEIFILSREYGLSHDEIAKKLNISKRTVENNIYRALKFLKKHLGEEIF